MQEFTGWQYLLIDAANNYCVDLDKKTFETRIAWAEKNLDNLEELITESDDWKTKPLFIKSVQAIRKAQAGEPTGHLVGFDAVCSGMQLMAVLSGCIDSARATGLIDPNVRADAYTECTAMMTTMLGYHLPNERAKVKQSVMTSLYGSKQEPKNEFGDDTPELDAFYKAMYKMAPGPCALLEDLLNSWQPFAKAHAWKLPDGHDVRVRTTKRHECRVEVDELNHSTFTYAYFTNEGEEKDKKNAANVIHSIDAYVMRSLLRRCDYDDRLVMEASSEIQTELMARVVERHGTNLSPQTKYYFDQYQRSGMVDVVILESITSMDIRWLPKDYLVKLNTILDTMLRHKPFQVVTVHDDFRAHPNNINALRKHYRNILAELSEVNLLTDIFSQLYGMPMTFAKASNNLAHHIRRSNYALC